MPLNLLASLQLRDTRSEAQSHQPEQAHVTNDSSHPSHASSTNIIRPSARPSANQDRLGSATIGMSGRRDQPGIVRGWPGPRRSTAMPQSLGVIDGTKPGK
jgi:hypothetical protein